jgi:hypothetical protein
MTDAIRALREAVREFLDDTECSIPAGCLRRLIVIGQPMEAQR